MLISNVYEKNGKRLSIAVVAALYLLLCPASAVRAQNAPSDLDLPTVEEGVLPDSSLPPAGTDLNASVLPPDPCPLPTSELSRMPDDLAKVQADIDRYTLCMERAQLLQRLNDVAMENQERLARSNNPAAPNPGMQLSGAGTSFEEIRAQIMSGIDSSSVSAPEPDPAPPKAQEWMIIQILGASGNLSAQLGKSDGTLTRVRAGDILPDGSIVNSIGMTSVNITQDGDRKELRWHDRDGV